MRRRLLAALGLACSVGAACQVMNRPLPLPGVTPPSSDAVAFLSPQEVTVEAHRPALIDLHFRVADGWHINSHLPLEKSLIPARLAVIEAPGLNVTAVDFPLGTEFALELAPADKLSVYTGEFVLHAHVRALAGQHLFQGALRYQACDRNACMPPHSIPVAVTVVAR